MSFFYFIVFKKEILKTAVIYYVYNYDRILNIQFNITISIILCKNFFQRPLSNLKYNKYLK